MSLLHRAAVVFATVMLATCATARAGIADARGADLEVSLVTYGPGEIYWERFGHDAIELRDRVSGEAVNFNYGVFDFNEKNFFLNFARGDMHYMMDAEPTEQEEGYYMQVGRSVTRQRLALDADQAAELRDNLLWNLRPQNAGYNYDYFADNCATRVRDALNAVLGDAIKIQLQARPGGLTYRQQTLRLMSAQPWLALSLDLGLGPYADHPLNEWQESFLPSELHSALRHVQVQDSAGGSRALVHDERVLSPNRLDVPPASPPDLRLPLGAAGLLYAGLIVLSRRRWPTGYALLGTVFLVLAGLVGLVLLSLWTLTSHRAAWANANLLLFNPLAFLLLPTLWRARRGFAASRFIDMVIAVQLLAMIAAVALHLVPGIVQQNQPWLLFALPCWLALAWSLRSRR